VPQSLVSAGWWQGARVAGDAGQAPERAWSLVSCVVTPGFDFADFELGRREALLAAFPQHRELVLAFT
jgi:predicted cupin superfamily sugar epimerase